MLFFYLLASPPISIIFQLSLGRIVIAHSTIPLILTSVFPTLLQYEKTSQNAP